MAGLLDIAPVTRQVHGVTVYGVSARGIAVLLDRFPTLRALLSGREVSAEDLVQIAPDAVAAIIAAGIGFPGDAEQENAADKLAAEIQFDFVEAILAVTLPGGVGPFMARIAALSGQAVQVKADDAEADQSTKAPDSTSPPPSSDASKRVTRRI